MTRFLQDGGADFLAGLVGIAVFAVIGLIHARRIRNGKIRIGESPPPVSEVAAVAEMLHHVCEPHPKDVWLLAQRCNVRFRVTVSMGFYVVERFAPYVLPPRPGSEVRVDVVVARSDWRYLPRFVVDVTVTRQGEVPIAATLLPTGAPQFHGVLYTQLEATAADMTEWARCIDAATPE